MSRSPLREVDQSEQDRSLYDSAPCGYVTATAEGRIVRANSTLARWLGRPVDELVNGAFQDLLSRGGRLMWLTHHLARLEDSGHLDAIAVDLVRADGTTLPALLSAVMRAPLGGGRPELWFTVVDASERRAYEQDLLAARRAAESAEWRMRALQQVTEVCSAAITEDELLTAAVDAVTVGLAVARTRLWLPAGPDGPQAAGWRAVPADEGAPPEVVVAAWESGAPVLPRAGRGETAVRAAVPFSHAGETCGVVEVVVPITWRGNDRDLTVLVGMAPVIGQALARVRMHRRLDELAHRDDLTGLANRRSFLEHLDLRMERADATEALALLFVDLDGFKQVNDSYGHLAGDEVLRVVGARLQTTTRPGDLVARLGGDEFAVLCPGVVEDAAERLAERVRMALAEPVELATGTVPSGASVGVAVVRPPFPTDAGTALLAAGDAAMYAQKLRGSRP